MNSAENVRRYLLIKHLSHGEDFRLNRCPESVDHYSNNTVCLELALLSRLFTVAIQEWGLDLTFNPVLNIGEPSPGEGRDRRLTTDKERKLTAAAKKHSNPMLDWIARIVLETGMRSSEVTTLCRGQVDVTRRIVRLLDTKSTQPRTAPLTINATAVFREALANPIRPFDSDLAFFGDLPPVLVPLPS